MDELKQLLLDHGAALVGCADLSELPPEGRSGLRYAISIAVALDPTVIARLAEGPTREYYVEFGRSNYLLNALAAVAAEYFDWQGRDALPIAPSRNADRATLSTPLPHKTVARLAGLGWIGRSGMLVTPEFGSAVRITTVLTDAKLSVDRPVQPSRCGDCADCAASCPAHAISGRDWSPGTHRDELVNARACCDAMKETSVKKLGFADMVCGVCIASCPWTRSYVKRSLSKRAALE